MPADRVIPDYTMDSNVPISRLDELHAHIAELLQNPDTPINAQLLDEVELQLNETNIPPLLPTVLVPLTRILRTTGSSTTTPPQDPSPLLSLTTKLLSPLPFSRVLSIADAPSLLSALTSPLAGANLLALTILHKAARTPAAAALLSTLPELAEALLTRWLDAQDVGVGERAGKVLGDLLDTDCDVAPADNPHPAADGVNGNELVKRRAPGHGRLWNMIFASEQFFAIIPSLCLPPAIEDDEEQAANSSRTARQTSIAQGRLLRLLPRLAALNMPAVSNTAFPHLIPLPQSLARDTGHGLLQWAALGMVDRSDVLMHLNLIDFFETFVSVMRVADSASATSSTSVTRCLVKAATANDGQLKESLVMLPDRTVEEEAEPLRIYLGQLLN